MAFLVYYNIFLISSSPSAVILINMSTSLDSNSIIALVSLLVTCVPGFCFLIRLIKARREKKLKATRQRWVDIEMPLYSHVRVVVQLPWVVTAHVFPIRPFSYDISLPWPPTTFVVILAPSPSFPVDVTDLKQKPSDSVIILPSRAYLALGLGQRVNTTI